MRSSKIAILLFLLLALVLVCGISFITFRVHRGDFEYYDREKGARRGEIRKAKENKKSLSLSQERFGVIRTLLFDEKDGVRRLFQLKATMALVDVRFMSNNVNSQETFLRPNGWLQEKVGWELPSGEEVECKNKVWRSLKTKKALTKNQVNSIRPFQLIRYYDAVKAVWDIQKNKLLLYQVHFTDYKKQDHSTLFDIALAEVLLKGYADEMTFYFKEGGKEEVSSKGLKLHFEKGTNHVL